MIRLLLAVCLCLALFAGWQTYRLDRARDQSAQDLIETMERMNADDLDSDDRAAVLERLRALSE